MTACIKHPLFAVLLFLLSCSPPPLDQRELFGKFSMNSGTIPDTIEFRTDGTYRHTVGTKDAYRLDETGKWYVEGDPGDRRITLEKFRFFENGTAAERPGFLNVEVEVRHGVLALGIDADGDAAYVKGPG